MASKPDTKEIAFFIRVNNDESTVTTIERMRGFNSERVSDQLELLGIFQNLVSIQQRKLESIYRKSLDKKKGGGQ